MPALDGVGLIERIRRTSDVPIIALTGFSQEYEKYIFKFSTVTVVQKPYEWEALHDLIQIELAQSRPPTRLVG